MQVLLPNQPQRHHQPFAAPHDVAALPLRMTSAPAVSLLGCLASSPESSSEGTTSDGELSDSSASDSSESEGEDEQDEGGRSRNQAHHCRGDRQPTSAPACLSDGTTCRFPQIGHHELKISDDFTIAPLGLGLGMGIMDSSECLQQQCQLPPSARLLPSSSSPIRRRAAGPHNRIASTSLPAKTQTDVAEEGSINNRDKLQRRSTFTAHATITRSGPRSASDSLRCLVALSCRKPTQGPSQSHEPHSSDEENAAKQPTALAGSRDAIRSAASRRLFAALSRNTAPDSEQAMDCSASEHLAAATPGFSARRSAPNRPPSLEQLRMRVYSGSGSGGSETTACKSASAAMRSPTTARNTPTSPSHRSVSCPLREQVGPWYQFGGVTVTVTPPTPRPQPKSPIMGYVLTNAGRPCHNVGFTRSQDDLELLNPPSFEIAPGKQRIIEERARESLAALRAIAEAEQHRRRGGLASHVESPQQRGIGLGWPASPGSQGSCRFATSPAPRTLLGDPREVPASSNPRSRLDQHQARALGRSGGLRRSSGRVSRTVVDKDGEQPIGKYIPPALRQRGPRRMSRNASPGAWAHRAAPVRNSCTDSDSDSTEGDGDEVVLVPNLGSFASEGGSTRTSSRHERWRRVEEMRTTRSEGTAHGHPDQRQAARQRMLSKLGQRRGVQCV